MRIGQLAARAGVNVQTILFYERRRLLPRPLRTPSGYRSYTDADLAQVSFIRETQQLGFTLREIAALMPIHGSSRQSERQRPRASDRDRALYDIVSARLVQVEAQIAALERIRVALRIAIDSNQSQLAVCPVKRYAAGKPLVSSSSSRRRRQKSA